MKRSRLILLVSIGAVVLAGLLYVTPSGWLAGSAYFAGGFLCANYWRRVWQTGAIPIKRKLREIRYRRAMLVAEREERRRLLAADFTNLINAATILKRQDRWNPEWRIGVLKCPAGIAGKPYQPVWQAI